MEHEGGNNAVSPDFDLGVRMFFIMISGASFGFIAWEIMHRILGEIATPIAWFIGLIVATLMEFCLGRKGEPEMPRNWRISSLFQLFLVTLCGCLLMVYTVIAATFAVGIWGTGVGTWLSFKAGHWWMAFGNLCTVVGCSSTLAGLSWGTFAFVISRIRLAWRMRKREEEIKLED